MLVAADVLLQHEFSQGPRHPGSAREKYFTASSHVLQQKFPGTRASSFFKENLSEGSWSTASGSKIWIRFLVENRSVHGM